MRAPLAVISGLRAGYTGRPLVNGVDLAIDRGDRIGILGANGSGKSTFLRSLMGLAHTYEGTFLVKDTDLAKSRTVDRHHAGVRLMLQGGAVFNALSVRQNLMLAAHMNSEDGIEERLKAAGGLLQTFRHLWKKPAGLLSAGQRQALAICMFVLTMDDAVLLMADEPTANLSAELAVEAMGVIMTAAPPEAATMIVEQNRDLTLAWGSRILWMDQGTLEEEQVPDTPDLIATLDGRSA